MPSVSAGYAPSLDKLIKSLKGQPLDASVESLLSLLKRRQIKGSEPCAIATAHILLQVVARSKWHDVDALIDNVSQVGRRLVKAQPTELAIGNIVRRVLGLIRDEAAEERHDQEEETQSEASAPTTRGADTDGYASPRPRPQLTSTLSSAGLPKTLFHLLSASPEVDLATSGPGSPFHNSGTSTPTWKGTYSQIHALRSEVIDGIEEIMDEISQVDDQIAALADAQIRPGDFVLTYRPSTTVERFLLRAAQKRKFTLFLAIEAAAAKPGAEQPHAALRKKLAAAGITVINIHNSGLMAYMSRVDKVILGAKAIVANGGVVATAGSAAVARAAKEHGTAVIVLSGVYKLSPASPFAEDSLIEWGDSSSFVNFSNGTMVNNVEIRSALTEMVPSAFIDTYITNLGTHSRDYLSSIIADHYKHQDVNFDLVGERMV
ncbi:translation regulator GCD7 [Cordyceps fumosorosea ARSEF 2679]|uniref:Translation initiation factor eIF2B subunit beta n=1 Tax=Cordyceps fumosorosea (strain ARSEF 2679) TaxID=1081104 RepID=A0A167LH89_CORFA|nr:translation regulator GCD7 [Cordyceps fumosorosea ARSEF 2679]OAA53089.1 translation regulator GCD7 [Cordyceps fumosorosea ARSEF 2679]